jgi:predicted Zn-dependent protease
VLDRDLTDPDRQAILEAEFVLSSVLPGTAAVISVHRLREIEDQKLRLRALKRLVVHTFGHILGVPTLDREHTETVRDERHCTHLCVMRAAESVDALLQAAAEEDAAKVLFCPACRADTLRSVLRQRLSSN